MAVRVLQLVWQAAGLAFFYFWGSSQSKESDGRIEAKIDRLLTEHHIDPADFDRHVVKETYSRWTCGIRRLSCEAAG
jgi:hypothetical protein